MIKNLSLSSVLPSTVLGASLLTVATVFGTANVANAATFGFSFSNEDGPVNGTVEGTIELPDGDGTFAATSIFITSAPAALGYTTPFDVLANVTIVFANSFTVTGGTIDPLNSLFLAQNLTELFGLTASNLGSTLNLSGSATTNSGVVDLDDSTLVFSSAATTSTPEPTTVFGLLLMGGVGLLSKRQKEAK
ncbi:MAG: PEP-CTERM sorting domain-containing protein [Crocosphaera sp.]